MTETLPAVTGDPDVLLAAIAKAAARLAAQETGRRAEPPDEDAVEEIAKRCVREAFERFDVYLDRPESVAEFREALAHLRRSRKWWDKAMAAIVTALSTILAGGVLTAVGKYVFGGVK